MKKNRVGFLLKNTTMFAIGNFSTKVISFLFVPIYTRVLTTSDYGIIDLLINLSGLLIPILILNINESILRYSLNEDADNNKIMSIGLFFVLIASTLGILIIPLSKLFSNISSYSIYLYLFFILATINQIFNINLRGQKKILHFSISNIMQALILALLNIYFLVFLKLGIKGYLISYIISYLISITYSFITGKVYIALKNFKIDKKLLKSMLKYSIVLLPTVFTWYILSSFGKITLTHFIGSEANGIYAISSKLPTILLTITQIFTNAWIYSAIEEKDSKDKSEYTNNVFSKIFAITVIMGMFLILITKPFLKIYISQEFYEAWKYTPFLILSMIFLTYSSFLSTYYNVHLNGKGLLKSEIFCVLINITLNLILIPKIGIYGAGIASCTCYFLTFIYKIFDTKKYINLNIRKEYIYSFILLILALITIYIKSNICYLLLFIEFLLSLIILKDLWLPLINLILIKIKSIKK